MRGGGGGPAVSSHSRVSMTAEGVLEGERRVPYREAPISRRYFWIPELNNNNNNNNNNNDNDNKKEQKMSRNERHNEAVDGGNETAPRSFFSLFFSSFFSFLSFAPFTVLARLFFSFFLSFFLFLIRRRPKRINGGGGGASVPILGPDRRMAGSPDGRMAGWDYVIRLRMRDSSRRTRRPVVWFFRLFVFFFTKCNP